MNLNVFIFGLVFIVAGSLVISFFTKKSTSRSDFFLAKRSLNFFPLIFTFVATQLGGGAILGGAEEAAIAGPFACFYTLGQSLGFVVLSLGMGASLRKFNISTLSEIFETKYSSRFLRKISSLISILSMVGILMSMALSSRKFILGLGIKSEFILPIFWIALITYTVFGGLKAVVNTDIFQALFLIIVLFFAFFYVIFSDQSALNQISDTFNFMDIYMYSKGKLFGWLVMPFLFTFVEQDLAQRFFAAKTPRTVSVACFISAIILIIFSVIPVFFGMLYKSMNIESGGSIFILSIIKSTNPIISALSASAVMAAIISTADSVLLAISSNICEDLYQTENRTINKFITILVGIMALVLSYSIENIISLLVKSYEISISCMIVPVFFACLGWEKNFKSRAVYFSVLFGFFGFIITNLLNIPSYGVMISIFISALGFFVFYKF